MEKLYAILKVDFTFNGTKLTNIKKLVLSNVITGGDFKVQTGQMNNTKIGSIEVKPANPAELLYVAIFPTNGFKPKFEVYTTDNKAYTYTVTASDWETKTAKVYPITVAVKEFTPNPPYVEVNNVKWGKYNLQYTPGSNADGWTGGYHLAANPWDYYYSDGRLPVLSTGSAAETDGIKSDHFRWGDISKAHNYGYDAKMHYDETVGDIKGQITTPNEFGDLPYYASQQQWRLPSPEDFEELMRNTTEYVGYYNDGTNKIYGALFVPDGVAHGWVLNKNNVKKKQSNQTGSIPSNELREFTKDLLIREYSSLQQVHIPITLMELLQCIPQEDKDYTGLLNQKVQRMPIRLPSICQVILLTYLLLEIEMQETDQKSLRCTASVQSTLVSK